MSEGPFDFGDREYLRRGTSIYGEMVKKRYTRSKPVNIWLTRSFVGVRVILYHLNARVDLGAIVNRETTVKT